MGTELNKTVNCSKLTDNTLLWPMMETSIGHLSNFIKIPQMRQNSSESPFLGEPQKEKRFRMHLGKVRPSPERGTTKNGLLTKRPKFKCFSSQTKKLKGNWEDGKLKPNRQV